MPLRFGKGGFFEFSGHSAESHTEREGVVFLTERTEKPNDPLYFGARALDRLQSVLVIQGARTYSLQQQALKFLAVSRAFRIDFASASIQGATGLIETQFLNRQPEFSETFRIVLRLKPYIPKENTVAA